MEKNRGKKEFRLPSDLAEVHRASERVLELLRPLGLSEAVRFDVRLCLEEALINAMKYGNRFERERTVLLGVEYGPESLRFTVEDQGEGFDVSRLQDCTRKENLLKTHGRGVYLIHQLMDKVEYNTKGNSVVMTKYLDGHGQRAARAK